MKGTWKSHKNHNSTRNTILRGTPTEG